MAGKFPKHNEMNHAAVLSWWCLAVVFCFTQIEIDFAFTPVALRKVLSYVYSILLDKIRREHTL